MQKSDCGRDVFALAIFVPSKCPIRAREGNELAGALFVVVQLEIRS
jgi:hypothetical protein